MVFGFVDLRLLSFRKCFVLSYLFENSSEKWCESPREERGTFPQAAYHELCSFDLIIVRQKHGNFE